MSLCYDFQKWIIVSLAMVTLSLTIGLVSIGYGINDNSSLLKNGIIAHTDPEISCNKMNSNCHYIFENQTVKLTEELFKACTIEKDTLWYGDFIQLNNSVNCNPIIDYYIDHNWQPWFSSVVIDNSKVTMIRLIAKDNSK